MTRQQLAAGATALGVPLDAAALDRFARYWALLSRWNARINLTRITDEVEAVDKHFLDSLAVVPWLGGAATLIDVGSGAGFPGVPCAIARPSLQVTLVEATQKKCAFLEAVKRELGLPLTIRAARLADVVRTGTQFDAVVSRAMLAPQAWVEAAAPLVATGGALLVMLGRERPTLTPPANFGPVSLHPYELPEGDRAIALLHRN